MDKSALLAWAERHGDGPVSATPDFQLSLSAWPAGVLIRSLST